MTTKTMMESTTNGPLTGLTGSPKTAAGRGTKGRRATAGATAPADDEADTAGEGAEKRADRNARPTAAVNLMASIAEFDAGETGRPLPFRLRTAVERVRAHICGLFGVKAATVSDAHVAKFLGRVSPDYLFRHLPGIGYQTEELLLTWAAENAPADPAPEETAGRRGQRGR